MPIYKIVPYHCEIYMIIFSDSIKLTPSHITDNRECSALHPEYSETQLKCLPTSYNFSFK
jgi:hypothetical protein